MARRPRPGDRLHLGRAPARRCPSRCGAGMGHPFGAGYARDGVGPLPHSGGRGRTIAMRSLVGPVSGPLRPAGRWLRVWRHARKRLRAFSPDNVTARQVRAERSLSGHPTRRRQRTTPPPGSQGPRRGGASLLAFARGTPRAPVGRWPPRGGCGGQPAGPRARPRAPKGARGVRGVRGVLPRGAARPRAPPRSRGSRGPPAGCPAALTSRPHPRRRPGSRRGRRVASSGPARRPGQCRRPSRRPPGR
jgi:hypothetical protein